MEKKNSIKHYFLQSPSLFPSVPDFKGSINPNDKKPVSSLLVCNAMLITVVTFAQVFCDIPLRVICFPHSGGKRYFFCFKGTIRAFSKNAVMGTRRSMPLSWPHANYEAGGSRQLA